MRRTGRFFVFIILIVIGIVGIWWHRNKKDNPEEKNEVILHNVYVNTVSGSVITGVSKGENQNWKLASVVTGGAINGIADLTLKEGKVTRIVKKPMEVTGKVLKIENETITLEEYGQVPLESNFVVYCIRKDGRVTQGTQKDINIGISDIRFVVAGDKICGAMIKESKIQNIRVLLKNTEGTSYDMAQIRVTANTEFTVTADKQTKKYGAGQMVSFKAKQMKGRAVVSTAGKGKIKICNLKRQQGVPEYRGILEIEKYQKALQVINEVSLEEYLYSVVPSEMPTSYSMEALKAQAVCARSYAVRQMKNRRLAHRGAHVDDSVSFQVYNNIREDERAIQAVNETKNQVVTQKGKVASTYFFSTTAGCTSGTKDVWFTKKDTAYLSSALQIVPSQKKQFLSEEEFITYIKEPPKTLDSSSPWYRWQVEISVENLRKSLEKSIKNRYESNPSQIQVKQGDGTYRSQFVETVGEIKNISVIKRGAGGVVKVLEVEGTKATIRIYTEYNIRAILVGEKEEFIRQDKKKATGLSILPSGFFYLEKKESSYRFYGGGYGHGVGMSQNGANVLATQGKKYVDILTFYFPGTSVQSHESL